MRRWQRWGWLVAAPLLAGCVTLPVDGPVTPAPEDFNAPNDVFYQPPGPQPGESPAEIVEHFLGAMTATPIQTNVAGSFLTQSARESWRPQAAVVVYSDAFIASSRPMRVELADAVVLDGTGRWGGEAANRLSSINLPVVLEEGQWRIERAPDALVVPREWFIQRFESRWIYYFDASGQQLVPETRFVPRGEQQATALVEALLSAPSQPTSVARSFLPTGTRLQLPVTVDSDGVANVELTGGRLEADSQALQLAKAQLSWTLRQVPEVTAYTLRVGDELMVDDLGESVVSVADGAEFEPTGLGVTSELYGLSETGMVRGLPPEFEPAEGFSERTLARSREFAVSPRDGALLSVELSGRSARIEAPDLSPLETAALQAAEPQVIGGEDLRVIGWDLQGQAWLLDRTSRGARIVTQHGEVSVPGVTGEKISGALISRDGSRLVAVKKGSSDSVLVARISRRDDGIAKGGMQAASVSLPEGLMKVRDVTWRSLTSIAVLGLLPGGLTQVHTVPLDGSIALQPSPSPVLSDDYRWLAGSPVESSSLYALSRNDLVDLTLAQRAPLPVVPRASTVRYSG